MTFTHDGTVFDLNVTYADVTGIEWEWTGEHNEQGEPLMGSVQHGTTLPGKPFVSLPDLYAWQGPLIPTGRPAAAVYRRVLLQGVA